MKKPNLKDILFIIAIIILTFTITKCTSNNNDKPKMTNNNYLYEVLYQQQLKINTINDSLDVLKTSNELLSQNYINIQAKYDNSLEVIKTTKFKVIHDTVEVEVYPADIVEQFINDCDSLNTITMKVIETKDLIINQQNDKIDILEQSEDVYKVMISNHIENEKELIRSHKKQKRKAFIGGLGTGFVVGVVVTGLLIK